MYPLFALTILLILYGTLYPFTPLDTAHVWDIAPRFLQSLSHPPGRGDALSNVVLFLPFGFFGMQALLPRVPRFGRLMFVCVLGGGLSFLIECTQTFIAGRDTSVFDLLLNAFGALAGACAGWVDWNRRLAKGLNQGISGHRPPSIFPLLLLGAWLGLRLFPYVPTIDFQHVKDAIKPLLTGAIVPVDVLRHFIICLVIGRLLQALLTPTRALLAMPVLVLGVIIAKPFLMTRVMNLSEIIGTAAAIAAWTTVLAHLSFRSGLLALLLAIQVAVQGMTPFAFTVDQTAFSFVPFKGFEGGSMAVNLQAFLEKIFLYGSLIWLLAQSKVRLGIATALSVVLLILIEIVQTRLDARVSEITEPLLAIILGCVLYSLERSSSTSDATVPRAKLARQRSG
jgi:glycopeptide antibiotics resistance protein